MKYKQGQDNVHFNIEFVVGHYIRLKAHVKCPLTMYLIFNARLSNINPSRPVRNTNWRRRRHGATSLTYMANKNA